MRSDERSEALDLERDLPTTPEDVLALRRAKSLGRLDLEGYLDFLAQLPEPAVVNPRSRRGPRGDRPFELGP